MAPPADHHVGPGAGAPGALKHRGNPDIHDLSWMQVPKETNACVKIHLQAFFKVGHKFQTLL